MKKMLVIRFQTCGTKDTDKPDGQFRQNNYFSEFENCTNHQVRRQQLEWSGSPRLTCRFNTIEPEGCFAKSFWLYCLLQALLPLPLRLGYSGRGHQGLSSGVSGPRHSDLSSGALRQNPRDPEFVCFVET
jgi:hypothetical protein